MDNKKTLKLAGATLAAAGAFVLLDSLVLEHVFFKIKKYKIGNSEGGSGKAKLVHLTDLHLKESLVLKHSKLAKTINRIKPDLLLISGDTIDEDGNLDPLKKFLPLLDRDIRIIAIPGNHEHKAAPSLPEVEKVYERYNGELLVNESTVVEIRGNRLAITGMDDIVEGDPDFEKAVEGMNGIAHHLALIHSPKHQESIIRHQRRINEKLPEEKRLNISYFFAGHNHGGQVTIGSYAPVLPGKSGDYLEGWYNEGEPRLYLSKGFGTSGVPFRFMARAEITFFDYYF